MHRRQFVTLIGGAALTWPLEARAQPVDRVRRIGVMMPLAESDLEAQIVVAAFVQRLQALGWTDGGNVRIDYRWAGGDDLRIQALAKQLVALQPDLIVARSSPVVAALLQQTRIIPIVFAQVVDAERQGFVATLAHPGGNITGFTNFEPSMGGKWIGLLKAIAPQVARVAFIFNPKTAPYSEELLSSVEAATPSSAVKPIASPVQDGAEMERMVATFAAESNGGLIILPDAFMATNRDLIIALAARHGLPAIYPFRYFAADGGLMSYGVDPADSFRQVASYVDRILRGAKPADLPVQTPTKFELVINLKTAKVLGIDVPLHLQQLADELIE
jgi:putative ABC transport system substrate-binding protein